MLSRSTKLLKKVGDKISVDQLRSETKRFFPQVTDFILALDTLFVLGKIDFNDETGVIIYVD